MTEECLFICYAYRTGNKDGSGLGQIHKIYASFSPYSISGDGQVDKLNRCIVNMTLDSLLPPRLPESRILKRRSIPVPGREGALE